MYSCNNNIIKKKHKRNIFIDVWYYIKKRITFKMGKRKKNLNDKVNTFGKTDGNGGRW